MGLPRRHAVVALLALVGLADVALVVGFLTTGEAGSRSVPAVALPFHPVAGSFRPDGTRIEDCSDQPCLEQALGNIAYREGPKKAIAALEQKVGTRTNRCHRIAHIIGSAALARHRGDVGRTLAEGSPTCFSGYYHGVLERSLVNVESNAAADLARISRGLCRGRSIWHVPELRYQCNHGLGHGLMITTGYDLPLSLRVCAHLATRWDATSCDGGVFMENISTSYGVRSRYVRDDDPLYPCNRVARADKLTCYQLVTSRILQLVGVDWEKVARTCSDVEAGWKHACFQSMGRDVAGQTRRDPKQILDICGTARPYDGERECVRFAAMDLTGNDPSGRHAATLCTSASPHLRGPCFRAVGEIMGRFRTTPRARAADCRSLTKIASHVAACVSGTATAAVTRTE